MLYHREIAPTSAADALAIEQALSFCQSLAEKSPLPVFLRVQFELALGNPWDLLQASTQTWGAWYDGHSDECGLALGSSHELNLDSDTPYELARIKSSGLREHSISLSPDNSVIALPLLMGGFSFEAAHSSMSGPWSAWSRNRIFVPEYMIWRKEALNSTVAVLNFLVSDNTAPCVQQIMNAVEERRMQSSVAVATNAAYQPSLLHHHHETQEEWLNRIDAVQTEIQAGELEKVVTARSVRFAASNGQRLCPIQTLVALRQQHPESYCFAFSGPDSSVFVGASPETLLRVNNGQLNTHALAGTTGRGKTPLEDEQLSRELLESIKDRGEQSFVVRAIEDALTGLSLKVSASALPGVKRLAQMQHLVTEIGAELSEETHLFQAVEGLHPTPAVGGWPVKAAQQWLAQNETMERGWYAAPVGWLDCHGNGVFAVAIRSALFQNGDAIAFAGAGIVAESDAQAEWDETELKLQTIADALRLSQEQA